MNKNQAEDQWEDEAFETFPVLLSQSYTLEEQLKEDILPHRYQNVTTRDLPETTPKRQRASISAQSLDQDEYLPGKILLPHKGEDDNTLSPQNTVLYLAYGSNLASETFLGTRGIKPLSQLNVLVPELRLTFDLPGIPYMEPCFAGTHFRSTDATDLQVPDDDDRDDFSEKHSLLQPQDHSHDQDRYTGPLIGVVYEVTIHDYAKIIATEGGGRGYKDIIITCYPFPTSYNPKDPIPAHPDPSSNPVKAHTLLSPAGMKQLQFMQLQTTSPSSSNPHTRPSSRCAQPSARYLKLITTGAEEHNLPVAYREYLAQIQPYHVTSLRQKVGKGIFVVMWAPLLLILLALTRILARPDGRSPGWVAKATDLAFASMWSSYDHVFRRLFGNGERTVKR
ncbi:hypothetical protein BJX99DRAFT_136682 [Aspergillus californicus]